MNTEEDQSYIPTEVATCHVLRTTGLTCTPMVGVSVFNNAMKTLIKEHITDSAASMFKEIPKVMFLYMQLSDVEFLCPMKNCRKNHAIDNDIPMQGFESGPEGKKNILRLQGFAVYHFVRCLFLHFCVG